MARPLADRRIAYSPPALVFKPAGIPARDLEEVLLSLDEVEALRLADGEGLYQEAAARRMGVSRQTFARILEAAHAKVADALMNGKCLRLGGGKTVLCTEGENRMKIAIPTKAGMVDEHFGHCEGYTIYGFDSEKNIAAEEMLAAPAGCGCKSNIVSVLASKGVTHLLAGGMGDGAARVLGSHGIKVLRGVSGEVRTVAEKFARGEIADSGSNCHSHGGCGETREDTE